MQGFLSWDGQKPVWPQLCITAGLCWLSIPGPLPAKNANHWQGNTPSAEIQGAPRVLSSTRLHLSVNCWDFIVKCPFPSSQFCIHRPAQLGWQKLATSLPSLSVPTRQKSDWRRAKIKEKKKSHHLHNNHCKTVLNLSKWRMISHSFF